MRGERGHEVKGDEAMDPWGGTDPRREAELERRARRMLDRAPRPLPGEGLDEYAERANAAVMKRAEREGGAELAREVLRLIREIYQRRQVAKAEGIVRSMPALPRPSDNSRARERRVLAWRAWAGRVHSRVVGDAELAARVRETMLARMELAEGGERADLRARDLLACGIGEVGLTPWAAEVLRRAGLKESPIADYLADEYARVWQERGEEMPVAMEVGGESLVAGMRDAVRVNVWVRGEPGTPRVTGEIREDRP